MNDRSNFQRESEQYSYSSTKYWCFSCQREFLRIRIDDTEAYCSWCGNICEEIIYMNQHPIFLNLPIEDEDEARVKASSSTTIGIA